MNKVNELKLQINNYIFEIFNEDNFKQSFKTLIIDEFKKTILSKGTEFLYVDSYKILRNNLKINIYKTLKEQNLKELTSSFIEDNLKNFESSNRTLGSIFPPAAVNGVKVYIYNHKDEIIDAIKKFISNENIDNKIHEEISNVLNGINPMVSRFVNPNNIFSKFKTSINEYLDDTKNITDIMNIINSQLDELMKKRISEFTSTFPAEGRKSIIDSISQRVADTVLSEKFIDMAIDKIEDIIISVIASIEENPEKNPGSFESILKDFLDIFYDKILNSDKSKELIGTLSSELVDKLLNKPLIAFLEP